MSDMPALHVRNVPADVVDALREQARLEGRSLNAAVVAALVESARRHDGRRTVTQRLAEIAERVALPTGAPRPETLIRADRDSG